MTVLKCNHTHHCDCIRDWLVKQKTCPICKKEVIVEPAEEGDAKFELVSTASQLVQNPESQ